MDDSRIVGGEFVEISPEDISKFGAREHDPRFQGIASSRGYTQDKKANRIQKLKYTHEALVDLIIAQPDLNYTQLAQKFGYTPSWIGRVINSDAFQAYLANRRSELTDPFLSASLEEQLRGLAAQSIDVLTTKLAATNSADLAVKGLDSAMKALGFGARDRGTQINNNFVVALPGKAESAESWATSHGGGTLIDAQPVQSTRSMAVRDPLKQPKSMTPAEDYPE